MTYRVLLVETGPGSQEGICRSLEGSGHEVLLVHSRKEWLERQESFHPDVVVLDIGSQSEPLTIMEFQAMPLSAPVIVTGEPPGKLEGVAPLRKPVVERIEKPCDFERLHRSIRQAAELHRLTAENLRFREELEKKDRRLREAEDRLLQIKASLGKRLERGTQALLESEQRYRSLFDWANDAIFALHPETGRIIDANRQAVRLTGYTFDELTSMRVNDLHPADQLERVTEFDRKVLAAGEASGVTGDLTFLTKSGQEIILSVSCSLINLDETTLVHRICRDVTKVRKMEGDLERYMQDLQRQFEDKKKALLESQAQLIQAEKMAALGNLVAGIAHEINTPLGSIHSNTDVFALSFQRIQDLIPKLGVPQGGEIEAELHEMRSIFNDTIRTNRIATDRIIGIVRSLRNFARLDEAERKKVNIHEGIESTLTLVAHELRRRVTVVKEFGSIPEIECYPNQLNQVFMNLLVNASQAIEGHGEIRIRTWQEEGFVKIAFTDNGQGIPRDLQAKVFDPGFTTKRSGLGTGLGLSICYRIIQGHGGRIELQSEVGRTTFCIVLPIEQRAERRS